MERFTYPWLEGKAELDRSFLLNDYDKETESLNITGMIFMEYVTATWDQAVEEAKWVYALSKKDPRIKGIIARAPLEMGKACVKYLDLLKSIPLVKGIRRVLQDEPELDFCLNPGFIEGTGLLAEYDLYCHICITHEFLAFVNRLVERCPNVNFVLDHLGKPDIKGRVLEPWKKNLKIFSGFPNTLCKISGMITEADHDNWKAEDLKPYIDTAVECFGFDRLMFGGDWPVCTRAGSYLDWSNALNIGLTEFSEDEKKKLLYDNAVKVYGLS
jgi:L-fuconolactonase